MKSIRIALLSPLLFAAGTALAQDKAGPSDPQIAGIVVAANQIDVDAGKLAKSRSKNPGVRKFAQQMIADHTSVNQQAGALVKKLGVKPEESDTSRSLKSAAHDSMGQLKALKGPQFDKAYVDHEVTYHEQVLDAIDKVLIPNAKNAELKALVTKVRPAIAGHLEHARMVQSDLAKK